MEITGLAETLADLVRLEVERQLADTQEGWLSTERAATYLSTTPEVVRDLKRRQGLPFHRAPGTARLLFRPSEIDEWVESGARGEPLFGGDR